MQNVIWLATCGLKELFGMFNVITRIFDMEMDRLGRESDGAERGGLFWMSGLRQIRERFNLEKEISYIQIWFELKFSAFD